MSFNFLTDLFTNREVATKKSLKLLNPFSPELNADVRADVNIPVSVDARTTTTTTTDSRQFTDSRQYAPVYAPQYVLNIDSPNSNLTTKKADKITPTNRPDISNETKVPVDVSGANVPIKLPVSLSAGLPEFSLFGMGAGQILLIAGVGLGAYLILKPKGDKK